MYARRLKDSYEGVKLNGYCYEKNDFEMMFIDQGMSIKEIADRIGSSWFKAFHILNDLGIITSWKADMPPRRLRVFKYMIYYIQKHQFPPTTGEIAMALGIPRSTVVFHCRKLKEMGYINWERWKRRSFSVTIPIKKNISTFSVKIK